jgi:glycosyltransferase involved in cell wall biosynthesis
MKKSKFGVVSSFDVLCGNATYSEAIAKGLEEKFDVLRIDIPLDLQKNYESNLVNEMVAQIRECDHVNIQMELGLYGPTPAVACKVLFALIKASKKFSITMHRVEAPSASLIRQLYDQFKRGSVAGMLSCLSRYCIGNTIYSYYKKIVDKVVKFEGTFIVHTEREERRIKKINKTAKTFVYPIVWPNEPVVSVDVQSKFDNNHKVIGLFGFISEYKNYEVVADALLDKPFNVFIAGGVHPQAPFYGKKSDERLPSYIRNISNRFSDPAYEGRVVMQTSPTDEELINLMSAVDIVCVPYAETGQSGSGIASLAIQYGKKVAFSDTHCTAELRRFLNARPVIFDVDSPLSFLCAVQDAINSSQIIKFNGYDFDGLLELYKRAS